MLKHIEKETMYTLLTIGSKTLNCLGRRWKTSKVKALTLQRKKTLENEKASYAYQWVGLILKMTILPESIYILVKF